MKRLQYTLTFNTPAFLGNAHQEGQWRTPPIKALLRHWWRMVHAPEVGFNVDRLRKAEALRFGSASDQNDNKSLKSLRSPIRLRLGPAWSKGQLDQTQWPKGFASVHTGAGRGVPSDVYLGFGPVLPGNRENRKALGTQDTAVLTLICPDAYAPEILQALQLIQWFGALGSRSRNGWGSITLSPHDGTPPLEPLTREAPLLQQITSPLEKCLQRDWAHAIGLDTQAGEERPLIWRTRPCKDWQQAVDTLADTLYRIRSAAKGHKTHVRGRPGALHLLGYPAGTNNSPWDLPVQDRNLRLASPLRFKVLQEGDQLRGIIVHTPSRPPEQGFLEALRDDQIASWFRSPENLKESWETIHKALDAHHERIV